LDDYLENAEEDASEDHGDSDMVFPGIFENITNDQKEDLLNKLLLTIDTWQQRHGLVFKSYNLEGVRDSLGQESRPKIVPSYLSQLKRRSA